MDKPAHLVWVALVKHYQGRVEADLTFNDIIEDTLFFLHDRGRPYYSAEESRAVEAELREYGLFTHRGQHLKLAAQLRALRDGVGCIVHGYPLREPQCQALEKRARQGLLYTIGRALEMQKESNPQDIMVRDRWELFKELADDLAAKAVVYEIEQALENAQRSRF